MVEALVCTQDYIRGATPISVAENTEELAKLEEGESISLIFCLLFSLIKLFVCFSLLLVFELTQQFKDKAITEDNASKS